MDYYFNNFKFNSQSFLLTQNDQPLPIRNNEANLLVFLLANPTQIHSKDAILENVWAGRVVSEQAVFQAVSNLRNLFGEDAIKTFSKKGYQWQIPLHTGEPVVVAETGAVIIAPEKRPYWPWSLALMIVLCLAALVLFFQQKSTSLPEPTSILVAPFNLDKQQTKTDLAGQLQNALIKQASRHQRLRVHKIPDGDQPQQIAAAPLYFFERYQQSADAQLLVTGHIRQHEQMLYLAFVVQGRSNQWRGYLAGQTIKELAEKLETLLGKVASLNVLWEARDQRLINAQLQILHSENPDDLAIHYQLIENLLSMGDRHSVKTLAEELELRARKFGNIPYQSLALLAQMYAGFQSLPAEKKLALMDRAVALAEGINDPILQSYLMERYTSIYYEQKNFSALEEKLLRALALAESSPEQQLQVLRSLSLFSFKFEQNGKCEEYLKPARAIAEENKLPGEVHAQFDDLAGLCSQDNHQKEFFYRSAINRFKPESESWVKEMAQRHLVGLFLSESRWSDALAVLAAEKELSGAELFMQALIYFKQNEMLTAQIQAEAAFKKANSQGEYIASLDAALLLAQIYKQMGKPDLQKNMREFFVNNALESWKKDKQQLLEELR